MFVCCDSLRVNIVYVNFVGPTRISVPMQYSISLGKYSILFKFVLGEAA